MNPGWGSEDNHLVLLGIWTGEKRLFVLRAQNATFCMGGSKICDIDCKLEILYVFFQVLATWKLWKLSIAYELPCLCCSSESIWADLEAPVIWHGLLHLHWELPWVPCILEGKVEYKPALSLQCCAEKNAKMLHVAVNINACVSRALSSHLFLSTELATEAKSTNKNPTIQNFLVAA